MLKYSRNWDTDDLVAIELGMIKLAPQGPAGAQQRFTHHLNVQRLLWPEDDEHRWSELALRELTGNTITVLAGSASSGKTYPTAKWGLVEYWCAPEETLVIVSSTDLVGLELRIWGAMKDLFNRALDKCYWLPGHVLESMHCITTEAIDDEGERARTLRKGIITRPCISGGKFVGLGKLVGIKQKRIRQISDECFPTGTPVDTPTGPRPIESIVPGDFVVSAAGPNRVLATMTRNATSLWRITTSDGRQLICTGNHPFLTQFGWVSACDLSQKHYMLSANETMPIMRSHVQASEQGLCVHCMPNCARILQAMWQANGTRLHRVSEDFLQPLVLVEASVTGPGLSGKVLFTGTSRQNRRVEGENVHGSTGIDSAVLCPHEETESDGQGESESQTVGHSSSHRTPAINSRWQWRRPHEGRGKAAGIAAGQPMELSGSYWREGGQWLPNQLQTGRGLGGSEVWCGGRWFNAQQPLPSCEGSQESRPSHGAWVESCALLEQEDFDRYRDSERGVAVHTLQVEGHSSYSVNGLVARNCQLMASSFLDAVPNLLGEGYVGVFLGNFVDPLDPLGRVAEPLGGWLTHPEPTKTETWATRFHGGRCVNFVGPDSPNFDYPQDQPIRYPWLINRKKIEAVEAFWGKDSLEYYSQCVGVMKSGLLLNRVINRDLCREHKANEKAHWKGTPLKRVYALDAAYGGTGGDRCVGGFIEWGEDVDGKVILRIEPPRIVPVSIRLPRQPEDQIAEFVLADAAANGIAIGDIFYDSTGRGTLGAAFARLAGSVTPVPVEFGGKPTARPVRHDLYVLKDEKDPSRGKRHKRCDEHYANFVTELWFSTRYVIECDQLRELPQDVMEEGCLRQFGKGLHGRYKVESKSAKDENGKPGMKERTGFSPDLYDWFCCGIEGARQRGFRIERLGEATGTTPKDPHAALRNLAMKARELAASKELVSA